MGMSRKMFRPGAGQTLASYTSAVATGDIDMYPGDLVSLSTLVPTSQGVSGVFEGKTLGAADYIECILTDIDSGPAGAEGLCLGFIIGKSINSVANFQDVSGDGLADGDVVIIQNYGVHPNASQVDSGAIAEQLAPGGTPGEALNSATIAAQDVGVNLVAASTYTRATGVTDTEGAVAFIRVGGA